MNNGADNGTFTSVDLAPGMRLFVSPTKKFKRTQVSLFVHDRLSPDTVAAGGLLPFLQKRGTKNHPTGAALEIAADELYNARLSGAVHKIGDRQVLEYALNVPADRFIGESILEPGLDLLGEMVYDPVVEKGGFHPEYTAQEKTFQIGRVKALINDKIRYAFFRATQEMFKGQPFMQHELGTEEGINETTPESLLAHHETLLATRPIDVYVVGDVDVDSVVEAVCRTVVRRGDTSASSIADVPPNDVTQGSGDMRFVTEEEDMNQGWLVIGMKTDIGRCDDDSFGLLFFNGILGGFPHSKLFVNVRERASLAYSAFSFYDSNKGILSAVAGIDVNKYDQALDIMLKQIDDTAAGDFSDDDLESTRLAFLTRYRMNLDSASGRIAHHLGGLSNGCPQTIEEVVSAVEKVGRDDIMRAARRVRKDLVFFLKGTSASS